MALDEEDEKSLEKELKVDVGGFTSKKTQKLA